MRNMRFAGMVIVCLLLCCVGNLLAQAPFFYDDFSDGRWQNRTGTDPWNRPRPEWKIVPPFPGGPLADPSYFSASNGWLCDVKKDSYYYSLEADFPTAACPQFELSFDLVTYIPQSTQDYFGIELYNSSGDKFEWKIKNDGHNWITAIYDDGYTVGLAGISEAPKEPYATGIEGPYPNTVYHYEIQRCADHKMYIIRNGQRVYGAWADSGNNPVGLEYEQTHSGNIELWDNAHLYHNSPYDPPGVGDGANFADRTIEGDITKIKLTWFHNYSNNMAWSIDNIVVTPEPCTLVLLLGGAAVVMGRSKRRRR